jgi:prepilin-type N-terminal cleavage/methylation domain-containing protein
MDPRGVTLVELLAAVSILVVVTALSLPAVQSRLAGARLDAAQGQVEAAVLAARAEAMRSGRALELLARAGKDGEVELIIRRVEQGLASRERQAHKDRRPGERAARTGSVWGLLPKGVTVANRALETGREGQAGNFGDAGGGPGEEPAPSGDVRIAVFCPDGTAIGSASASLSDGESELAIRVNEWIGGASLSPVAAADTAQDSAEESPVTAEDMPKPPGAVR